MYDNDLLWYLKDINCSPIFFAHRAQNLGEAFFVISTQSLHCAKDDKHLLVLFRGNLYFVPK